MAGLPCWTSIGLCAHLDCQCGTLSRSVAWATAFLPWRTKCFLRCSLDNRCHAAPGFGFFTATTHAKTLRCSRSCCSNLKTRRAQVSTKPRLRTPAALLLHAVQHISCHAAVPCCTPQPIVRQPQVHRCKASAPCAACWIHSMLLPARCNVSPCSCCQSSPGAAPTRAVKWWRVHESLVRRHHSPAHPTAHLSHPVGPS